jgi:hypothetical protein
MLLQKDVTIIFHASLTYYDTPGWGNEELRVTKQRVTDFISNKYREYQANEKARMEATRAGLHFEENSYIHLVFYFILPHRVKAFDLDFISQLQEFTPVLLLLAKADRSVLLTSSFLFFFVCIGVVVLAKIVLSSYEAGELKEMYQQVAKKCRDHIPPIKAFSPNRHCFAIVGTNAEGTRSLMWSKQLIRPWNEQDPISKHFDNITLLRYLKTTGFNKLDGTIKNELYPKWNRAVERNRSKAILVRGAATILVFIAGILLILLLSPVIVGLLTYFNYD